MTRAILSVLVLLALPAAARADVFVPADPPVAAAECISGARDVIALGLHDHDVVVDGKRVPGFDECPVVAAAADGTAAVASGRLPGRRVRIVIRRPGGAFGAPVTLPTADVILRVAAAPGGWVAVVWTVASGVRARVFAPDGTSRTTTLDHGTDFYAAPRIGIDSAGRATAVWTAWDVISGRYALRVARSTGATWSPAGTLADGRRPLIAVPVEPEADVAVTPSGHTLIAWAPGDGIAAELDGAPLSIATTPRAGSPAVALTDAGAAAVAFATPSRDVLVSDRAAGGAWVAPHAVGHGIAVVSEGTSPALAHLDVVAGDDGRAAAVWQGGPLGGISAAAGVAGGAWGPAEPISSPARHAGIAAVSLGPAGEPRLLWVEVSGGTAPGPARGARLAPAPPALDTTPPGLVTALPSRVPRRRPVRVRVPVTCAEACDARLSLLYGDHELAASVKALRAGRRAVLGVRLVVPRGPVRVRVLVADRAGNVTRRSRALSR